MTPPCNEITMFDINEISKLKKEKSSLEGKSTTELKSDIRILKTRIGFLKGTMEHPGYEELQRMPGFNKAAELEEAQIQLEKTIDALIKTGEPYKLSASELRAKKFDDNIQAIDKIMYGEERKFGNFEVRTYTIAEAHVHLDIKEFTKGICQEELDRPKVFCAKEEFLAGLRELRIGEWRRNYDPSRFDCVDLDGIHWELEISFSNKCRPFNIQGTNSYPYNFKKFRKLLGLKNYES